jgi:hypothetical protein
MVLSALVVVGAVKALSAVTQHRLLVALVAQV